MVEVTYYVALPFIAADDGVAPGVAAECQSVHAAIRKAEQLAKAAGNVGAVAFSRSGDPNIGEFSDAVLLKGYSALRFCASRTVATTCVGNSARSRATCASTGSSPSRSAPRA